MKPVLLAHAGRNDDTIRTALGSADYSYYFVLKEFLRMLDALGTAIVIDECEEVDSDRRIVRTHDVASQVDAVHELCRQVATPCLFLSFAPPHATPLELACPTVPVFAWEFYDIPCESWDDEPRHDWVSVLRTAGAAITHSEFSARVVREALGEDFPVAAVPAPVWSRVAGLDDIAGHRPNLGLRVARNVHARLDSRAPATEGQALRARATLSLDLDATTPTTSERSGTASLRLQGVVYTTVLNPRDGRKNWQEIVCAFCLSFRDRDDATLVLKLIGSMRGGRPPVANLLARLRPFRCRVVVVDAFLSADAYTSLARASTYTVNASSGEGQCLPLMEYMSCGRPAIAPRHTGLEDYVDETNAFLVETSLEPAVFPQDTRQMYRTSRHRLNAASLMTAFRESHRVAREEPERYLAMSEAAVERLRRHCSNGIVCEKLVRFLLPRIRASGYPDFKIPFHGEPWPGSARKLYSQGNEELIVRDFFGDQRGGVFVDVGCNHPLANSTSCYLERHLGWSGIGVDALPEFESAWARTRPRTTFIHAIATDHTGAREDFFRVPAARGLSSTDASAEPFGFRPPTERLQVHTSTLDALLDAHALGAIDFLSIDVERSELKVLAGFDIARFRPRLVCIERASAPADILAYFTRHGYERIERYRRYDPINWYFRPVSTA